MKNVNGFLTGAVLILAFSVVMGVHAQEVPLPAGRISAGGRFSDWEQEGIVDVLVPVWQSDDNLTIVFVNPRGSFKESAEQEVNFGVGMRRRAQDRDMIFGANVFYDRRYTRYDNEFDQIGAGLELLSQWFDARANYYFPDDKKEMIDEFVHTEEERVVRSTTGPEYIEDGFVKRDVRRKVTTTVTTRYFARWEEAQEGFDVEAGVKIPGLPEDQEVRVFAGYYDFETPFSNIEAKGWKGRLEARLLPGVVLDAEVYENKKLSGVDFIGGFRVEVPFDLVALSQGRNPFSGAFQREGRAFADRMTEMVIRDTHVRTEESGYVEEGVTKTTSSSSRTTTKIIEEVSPEEPEYPEQPEYPEEPERPPDQIG